MRHRLRMRLSVVMGLLVLGVPGCRGEFASSTIPTVSVEPVALFPDTLANKDTARLQVRLQVDGKDSGAALGVQVVWASSDSQVVEVEQDTAPSGSDSLQLLAAGLAATIHARRPGHATITVEIHDGTGIAERVALTRRVTVMERWMSVSAGLAHTCAINVDSVAYCWGGAGSFDGLLGNGSTSGSDRPVAVAGLSLLRLAEINAGGSDTCARDVGGAVFCWGMNDLGEIGDGSMGRHLFPSIGGGGFAYSSVSVGVDHSCGIRQDEHVLCWGKANRGELGIQLADFTGDSLTVPCEWVEGGLLGARVALSRCYPMPLRVVMLRLQTSLAPLQATNISSGGLHTCAVSKTSVVNYWQPGDVVCWGVGTVGQLGFDPMGYCSEVTRLRGDLIGFLQNPFTTVGFQCGGPRLVEGSRQVGPFREVAAGWDWAYESHTCALTIADMAYCWGKNTWGQLGTPVSDPSLCAWDADSANRSAIWPSLENSSQCHRSPAAVEGGIRFASIGAGAMHTCGVGARDSIAYCWGSNVDGQLGDGSNAARAQPGPITSTLGLRFTALSVGAYHSCGVAHPSGAIYCWGAGGAGELGDGGMSNQDHPVRVQEHPN